MAEQLTKAIAIGVAAGFADTGAVSGWLHRSKTHNTGFKLKPPLEYAARAIVWMSGTDANAWARTHRRHHKFADKPGDPHSPWLQGSFGILKVLYKNPALYNNYNKQLEAENEPWPDDLLPDRADQLVFKHRRAGLLASLAVHASANVAVGNRAYMGAVSFAVEKLMYLAAGGFVNGIGHGGKHPWKALVTGKIESHENGSLGADSLTVALATLGEGNQGFHHENEDSLLLCDTKPGVIRALRDPVGVTCLRAVDLKLATYEPPETLAA